MRITELPARTCNELAKMDIEYFKVLPAVLHVIEPQSFLHAAVIAHPKLVRAACEVASDDVTAKSSQPAMLEKVIRVAAMYTLGTNDPDEFGGGVL